MVPLDVGAGPDEGGDFAFGGAGWVLKCEPGDVLVYNGCELHGTSEFAISSASDSRVFAAFYCNAKTMDGRCDDDRLAIPLGSAVELGRWVDETLGAAAGSESSTKVVMGANSSVKR